MFMPVGGLYRRQNLARDAHLREGTKRGALMHIEIAYRFEEADHPLLDDIIPIGAREEVRTGF
jgi:hypothetical protein